MASARINIFVCLYIYIYIYIYIYQMYQTACWLHLQECLSVVMQVITLNFY